MNVLSFLATDFWVLFGLLFGTLFGFIVAFIVVDDHKSDKVEEPFEVHPGLHHSLLF